MVQGEKCSSKKSEEIPELNSYSAEVTKEILPCGVILRSNYACEVENRKSHPKNSCTVDLDKNVELRLPPGF